MPRTSKRDAKLQEELAALAAPDYLPSTTREIDAPANLRRHEFGKLRYDYDSILDDVVRATIQDAAVEINLRRKRAAEDILVIGARLLEVQEMLPYDFTTWVQTEFEYSLTTARDFMNAARRFADEPDRVLDLPPTVLRLLAAPTLPDAGVDAILELAEAKSEIGEKITKDEAKAVADQYRAPEDKKTYRRERIARTIAGTYSVQKTDDPLVKSLLEAPPNLELAEATQAASKEQLQKAIALLPPDDRSRRETLEHAVAHYDRLHKGAAQANGMALLPTPKGGISVTLPRPLWGKVVSAFKAFDLNPTISDKEALKIVRVIEQSLETQ